MVNLIISDLHLDENNPKITELFLRFLKNDAIQADALYILGDFFETWIGDDDTSPFNLHIIQALRKVSEKISVFIMHGNRDFLLGKRFMQATGCQLLPDEFVADIAGHPTLLMHGDTLCSSDISYLKFRKKSRKWIYQKLFLLKSLENRRKIATKMREISKSHTSTTPDYLMDVTQTTVEKVMQKHQVQHLIHGHTHRPNTHQFILNNKPATRTVLGAWHDNGNVLVTDSSGIKEWHILN